MASALRRARLLFQGGSFLTTGLTLSDQPFKKCVLRKLRSPAGKR